MAITRAQLSSLSELASWMQANAVPNIFKSVTFANDTLTATDDDDNTVLKINNATNGYFRAYRTSTSYISIENVDQFPRGGATIDIIGCENGFIVNSMYGVEGTYSWTSYKIAFLVTKTNNGKLAVIFNSVENSASNLLYSGIKHVAFGDSTTLASTTTFTPESGNQTNFCTFCTNADITDVSYTPKAFYLHMHSAYNSGIGKFLSGGKVYITNGYWAIDTEQTEEDAT